MEIDFDIAKIQKVQKEILLEFDRICKKNGIKYQLTSGTLLGAVRHNGFIPWDDDIDVFMLRDDYKRFIEYCKYELNKDYFLQTYKTDKNCFIQYAKIRKSNTLFIEQMMSDIDMHHGIYIDVFPFDNILDDSIAEKLQIMLIYFLNGINLMRKDNFYLIAKVPLNKPMRIFVHNLAKIIPKKWLDKSITKLACMFNNKNTKYITNLSNNPTKSIAKCYMMEMDKFEDTMDIMFEGNFFPIPKNYDEILKNLYGDYMTLPPVEKQVPHHNIIKVSFDNSKEV